MEKKEPRTFEEYNFQEFYKTKKENENLKEEINDLKAQVEIWEKSNQRLIDLMKCAFNGARIEDDNMNNYLSVYVGGNFVGLYDPKRIDDEDKRLVALVEIINLVSAIPVRE